MTSSEGGGRDTRHGVVVDHAIAFLSNNCLRK
jgi:hypothetical protein